ncbi:MAG: hypothetical protein H5T62_10635 [Anaerolineae bacterium]|nr:hypothetical protein [Anaerolineae bacterium]
MSKAIKELSGSAEKDRDRKKVHSEATRRDARLAALPPLILGLSLALSALVRVPLSQLVVGGPTPVRYSPGVITGGMMIGIGALGLAALLIVVGGVIAVARRLPLWGHTWTGAAVMIIVFSLMVAGDDLPYLVSPLIDLLIMFALLLLLGAALGAAGWRGPWWGGLAGLSTTMILSLVLVFGTSNPPFNRLDIALLTGPLGLLYGGLLYGFVRGKPTRRTVLLATGGLLCLGALWSAEHIVFWHWRLTHGQTEQVWVLLGVGLSLLAFGPAIGLVTQKLWPRMV